MSVLSLHRAPTPAEDVALERVRRPAWSKAYARRVILLDGVLSLVASLLALAFRFGTASTVEYVLLTLGFPLAFMLSAALGRSYEPRFLGDGSEEYRRLFDSGIRLLALGAVVSYALQLEPARGYVLIAFPVAFALTMLGRLLARQQLHRARRDGRCLHRVVVTGTERAVAELVRQLHSSQYAGLSVVGACVDRSRGPVIEGVPVLGRSSDIVRVLADVQADTVAVGAWSSLSQRDLRRLSWELEGTGVSFVVAPSVTDVAGPRIHIRPIAGLPLLHIEEPEFTGSRRVVKGLFDRGLAAVGLLVLLPVLLGIGLAVRMTSPGPALFRQERIGRRGETFSILKFRSMRQDAEAALPDLLKVVPADTMLFKMAADPRVTRLGAWLRRFSIDELPQLVNVLKGEMSLVGPRPPLATEVARYHEDVHRRLLVKPGLTGLWQVSGRSDLSWDESVRLDLHYVENWSLSLDFVILAKTVRAVLRRRGAY